MKAIALFLLISMPALGSEREQRLLDRSSQNIAIAQVCFDERNYDCFEEFMFSAILKLDAIEGIDTVDYVLRRLTREQAWHLIDLYRSRRREV